MRLFVYIVVLCMWVSSQVPAISQDTFDRVLLLPAQSQDLIQKPLVIVTTNPLLGKHHPRYEQYSPPFKIELFRYKNDVFVLILSSETYGDFVRYYINFKEAISVRIENDVEADKLFLQAPWSSTTADINQKYREQMDKTGRFFGAYEYLQLLNYHSLNLLSSTEVEASEVADESNEHPYFVRNYELCTAIKFTSRCEELISKKHLTHLSLWQFEGIAILASKNAEILFFVPLSQLHREMCFNVSLKLESGSEIGWMDSLSIPSNFVSVPSEQSDIDSQPMSQYPGCVDGTYYATGKNYHYVINVQN